MKDQSATTNFGAGRRSKYRHSAPAVEVQAITNAAVAHSEDMHHRMVQYSVTMGIRMVCIAAIFVFDGWFKLVPIVGAVVLPWVAVMIANGGADINHRETVDLLDEAPMYAVGAGETPRDDADPASSEILTGEIVPDQADDAPAGEAAGKPEPAGDAAAAEEAGADGAAQEGAGQDGAGQDETEKDRDHEHL